MAALTDPVQVQAALVAAGALSWGDPADKMLDVVRLELRDGTLGVAWWDAARLGPLPLDWPSPDEANAAALEYKKSGPTAAAAFAELVALLSRYGVTVTAPQELTGKLAALIPVFRAAAAADPQQALSVVMDALEALAAAVALLLRSRS